MKSKRKLCGSRREERATPGSGARASWLVVRRVQDGSTESTDAPGEGERR